MKTLKIWKNSRRKELKKKRNNIQKAIKREQKQINKEEIENATNKTFSSKHGYKFFKAIKYVRNPQVKQSNIVHDKTGKNYSKSSKTIYHSKTTSQKQFYDASKIKIKQFIGNTKPLSNRITIEEIKIVKKNSNNNKDAGSDEIQIELIK